MVGVTALVVCYMAGDLFPQYGFSSAVASPTLAIGFCVIFSIFIGYIAYRGANASTGVNLAVNIVQISALLVFAVIAVAYRANHPDGATGWTLDPDGNPTKYALVTFAVGADGNVGTFKAESDGTVNQYVTEVDKDNNSKKDDKGNYIFKKDDKGNLIPALTYKVETDEKGDPKHDDDGNWVFAKDKDGKLIPADTYKTEVDDKGNVKKGDDGNPIFVKDKDGKYIPDPKGANLPSDQQNPADGPQYFPDEKGVYVVDNSGAGKPLALTDADKPKEKAETNYYLAVDDKGQPTVTDKAHEPALLKLDYKPAVQMPDPYHPKQAPTRQWFTDAGDVVKPHGISYIFIQACVAILILVGFESVTSMGEEAKNPKKHIPWAIILSLAIQGGFCYLIEYFAAGYFLNPGYPMTTAASATAPIGDMMKLTGAWLFGSAAGGEWFMRIEALTVFLALIGTCLACLNTGARVTYAMGRDDEVPSHFGMLHGKNLTSAPRHLDAGGDVERDRHRDGTVLPVRPVGQHQQRPDDGHAPGEQEHLVSELPDVQVGRRLGHPQQPDLRHADQQLRHVPALHAELHHGHRGLPRTPHVQRDQAHGHPGVRAAGQPRLHVVLHRRPLRGGRHELERAVRRTGLRRPVGPLRLVLLHVLQQGQGQVDPRDFPADAHGRGRKGGRIHHRQLTGRTIRPPNCSA